MKSFKPVFSWYLILQGLSFDIENISFYFFIYFIEHLKQLMHQKEKNNKQLKQLCSAVTINIAVIETITIITFFKSSRSQIFFKITVLKNFAKFTRKHLKFTKKRF